MKLNFKTAAAIAAIAVATPLPAKAQLFPWDKEPEASYVVVSNSAGAMPADDLPVAQKAAFEMLMREIKDGQSPRGQSRQIQVIFTTHPNDVAFDGTGAEIEQHGARLSARLETVEKLCNDLGRIYENIKRDIALRGYKRVRIVHIGPFVDVPSPCQGGVVNVPQPIRDGFALAGILRAAKYAEFTALMVHPDQYPELFDYLRKARLTEKRNIKIELLRPDQTRTRINYRASENTKQNSGGAQ